MATPEAKDAPPVTEEEQAALDEFLLEVQKVEESPPEVLESIVTGVKKKFAAPNATPVSHALGREVSIPALRRLLYSPTAEDMASYPELLKMAPPGAGDDHPQTRAQVQALTVMYLVHSKKWERMRPMVEAGGLRALVGLMGHSNLYLRSQAMSVFIGLSGEEAWWPVLEDGKGAKSPATPDAATIFKGDGGEARRQMYLLTQSPLIKTMIAQYDNPFPGASNYALRILAFYMSWLRYHFTKDRRLPLSQELLDLLSKWSKRDDVDEDERELAGKLYEDFGKAGAASAAPQRAVLGSAEDTRMEEDFEAQCRVVESRTSINSGACNEAEKHKEAGNEAFRKKAYTDAIRHYSLAIDAPVPNRPEWLATESARRTVYHSNRAAAYIGRAREGGGNPREFDTVGHMEACELGTPEAVEKNYRAAVMDCDEALTFDEANCKAMFRKAQALDALGDLPEAVMAALRALDRGNPSVAMAREITAYVNDLKQRLAPPPEPEQPADAEADDLYTLD